MIKNSNQGVRHLVNEFTHTSTAHQRAFTNGSGHLHDVSWNIIPYVSRLSTDRLDSLLRFYPLHHHIKQADLLPDNAGNRRFLPADKIYDLAVAAGARAVVLSVGMGAGKTQGMKDLLSEHFGNKGAMVSHRIGLVSQTASRLGIENYQDLKTAVGGIAVDAFATTIHSLPQLLELESTQWALSGGVIGLDESESIAAEFLTSTIKNEAKTLEALRNVAARAGLIVMMDAHAGAGTTALLQAIGYQPSEVLVITADVYELTGYTARVYAADEPKEQQRLKTAFMGAIIRDLRDGLKVIVTSLSKDLLDELERHIEKKVSGCRLIKISSDTSASKEARALNADTYGDYQAVLISPSMSTGVSFDRDNADSAYVFAINATGTGAPNDALQAMLRDRAVKSRCINIYYQAPPVPITTEQQVILRQQLQSSLMWELVDTLPAEYQAQFERARPNLADTLDFVGVVAGAVAASKCNFLPILERELTAKGATVERPDIASLSNDELSTDERKAVKEAIRLEKLDAVITAPSVSALEAGELKRPSSREKGAITERLNLDTPLKIRATLDRHKIERECCVSLEALPEPAARKIVESVVELRGNANLMNNVREWERARATREQLETIRNAAVIGVAVDEYDEIGFLEKITTDKTRWPDRGRYGAMVLKAVGITFDDSGRAAWDGDTALDGDRIRQPTDRGYQLFQAMTNGAKRFAECGLINIATPPLSVKRDKLTYLLRALEPFGISCNKKRGTDEYTIDSGSVDALLTVLNARVDAGKCSIAERLQRISDYMDNAPTRKERAARRFADFVTTGQEKSEQPKKRGEGRAAENILRAIWAESRPGMHGIEGFLAEFAGDFDDIEAGVYSDSTLRMVVKDWVKLTP